MFAVESDYQRNSLEIDVDTCTVQQSHCSYGKRAETWRCRSLLMYWQAGETTHSPTLMGDTITDGIQYEGKQHT